MVVSLDLIGRLLISAPFLGLSLAMAVSMLGQLRHAWTLRDRITIVLLALALASPGVGITVMIATDDDLVWCTEENRDDPRCKQV